MEEKELAQGLTFEEGSNEINDLCNIAYQLGTCVGNGMDMCEETKKIIEDSETNEKAISDYCVNTYKKFVESGDTDPNLFAVKSFLV